MAEPSERIIELEPGHYKSIYEDFPGSIRFPHPLLYVPHFQEYWQKTIEPMQDVTRIQWNSAHLPWIGAKHLIAEYGKWDIDGISPGDLKSDSVPVKVQQWVCDCARHYLEPELRPQVRLVVFTLI